MTLGKLVSLILALAALAYAGLAAYPQALNREKREVGNFTFYSSSPITGDLEGLVFKVSARVSRAQYYNPGDKFTIIVADSTDQFNWLAPFSRGAFSSNCPLTGHIFLASADFEKMRASRDADTDNNRSLEGALVHALIHETTRRGIGWLKYHFAKPWKVDGYAEAVADETFGFSTDTLCDKKADTLFLKWYENRIGVEYMMREEKLGYRGILDFNRRYDLLMQDVHQRYCRGR